jgi:hypothetical protein
MRIDAKAGRLRRPCWLPRSGSVGCSPGRPALLSASGPFQGAEMPPAGRQDSQGPRRKRSRKESVASARGGAIICVTSRK